MGRVGGGEVCREGMWGVKGCVGGGGVKKWRVEGSEEGVCGKEREEVCDSGGVMERGWSSVRCVVEVEG